MPHPATLLPWYQNGTLSEAERARVSAHLQTCAQCRAELETLREVRDHVHAALEADAVPTGMARKRVMQNIRRAPVAEQTTPGSAQSSSPPPASRSSAAASKGRSFLDGIAGMLRALMAPKWAPTAAVMLIALQGGLLFWTAQQPATPPPVTARTVGTPTAQIRVRFVPSASEADIRALLATVRGRIVDGPSAEGVYVVEVLAADAARAAAKVDRLRERSDLVQLAERVPP